MKNLFDNLPQVLQNEQFDQLLNQPHLRIERIVSRGHTSPASGWYDQDEHEWVAVLQGAGRLQFEDGREVDLGPGDWLTIPAHCRHRVVWTEPDALTVWLAVFYL